MAINKTDSGWLVDVQPGGRGKKRFRKTLPTKAEALQYETWVKGKYLQAPEWKPAPRDSRRLSELVGIWYEHHGRQLRAGPKTHRQLLTLCVGLGDPPAFMFGPEAFAQYRARRLSASTSIDGRRDLPNGISANSLNREHAYLRAMFNELRRLGHWRGENPLSQLRQFKIPERELSYLTLDQARILLKALEAFGNRDALLIAKLCLATGARWSEAQQLKRSQPRAGKVQFAQTKSGKNRAIPLAPELMKEIETHAGRIAATDRIFRPAYKAFRDAVKRSGIKLPRGQLSHVLRHSFASHFMMNGGNILALQRILGHGSLTMTMRYAHLAPDHLQEAATLNPLARLSLRRQTTTRQKRK